jgi:hypothetical protein
MAVVFFTLAPAAHAAKVVGTDVYGLDREGDGSGCESYGP